MWKTLLICVIAGSLSVASGQEPVPAEPVPVPAVPSGPEISSPLHVPFLKDVPGADRVFRNVGTARIAAPAEVLGEKTDHLLKAAAHLEAAGRTDEARQLRQEAEELKNSAAKRLAVLEAEVQRLRRLIGAVPTVLVEVKIVELSRDKLRKLGIDFAGFNDDAANPAKAESLHDHPARFEVVDADGSILKMLAALRKDGLLRTLSEPTLVTLSGHKAEFCCGGEVPYPVEQDDGSVAIEYKEFGTRLELLPTVIGKDNVRLEVRARLSKLDSELGLRVGKLRCPGLLVREIQAGIELRSEQTLVIRGLLQKRTTSKNAARTATAQSAKNPGARPQVVEVSEEIETLVLITPRIIERPAAVSARVPAPEATPK